MSIEIVPNVFNEQELEVIYNELINYNWELNNSSYREESVPLFWLKTIPLNSKLCILFKDKIESGVRLKIEMLRIRVNGQTHSQCGEWHLDNTFEGPNLYSFVYFPMQWKPEYGGHLLLQVEDTVHSILPEYNKAVLFDTSLNHIGLEPTIHCKSMRESIACTFRIINE